MAETCKPYFGDVSGMTYLQWLDRYVELAIGDGDSTADTKAANKMGDRAYRAAMRGWQDRYWESVGLPCGQTRLGPGRRRLTRAGHEAEKAQAGHAATLLAAVGTASQRHDVLESRVAALREEVTSVNVVEFGV